MIKGLSLFASAGIGETFLKECGVQIIAANEIIEKRAALYRHLNPDCKMTVGDFSDERVFEEVMSNSKGIDFLLASPPCQGMSVAGKNRFQNNMVTDGRNYLIFLVIKAIQRKDEWLELLDDGKTFTDNSFQNYH